MVSSLVRNLISDRVVSTDVVGGSAGRALNKSPDIFQLQSS